MKSVKELGFLKTGMVLVDRKGNKGTITKLSGDVDCLMVEINNDSSPFIWNWDKVCQKLMVADGSYKEEVER